MVFLRVLKSGLAFGPEGVYFWCSLTWTEIPCLRIGSDAGMKHGISQDFETVIGVWS